MFLHSLAQQLHKAWIAYASFMLLAMFAWLFQSDVRPQHFIIALLLSPTLLYIAYQGWNIVFGLTGKKKDEWYFSWRAFFFQDNAMFLISLALLITFMNVALIKTALLFYDRSTHEILQLRQTAFNVEENQ